MFRGGYNDFYWKREVCLEVRVINVTDVDSEIVLLGKGDRGWAEGQNDGCISLWVDGNNCRLDHDSPVRWNLCG